MPKIAGVRLARITLTITLWVAFGCAFCRGGETPDEDSVNPLHPPLGEGQFATVPDGNAGFANLWEDADLTLRSTYYGRARGATDRMPWKEIHVNAFGQGVDFRSGYAWGVVGFDVGGQTNLGRGNGWSEVLLHKEPGDRDRSSASLNQAALKTKLGTPELGFEARGGFTPISVGTLGTSGGLHSHGYRGFETKLLLCGVQLGYGWADRFRNEWDNTFRRMTTAWHQGRFGYAGARRISYAHSLGARYEFGPDKAGFVDVGIGEGHRYRRNAQAAVSVPIVIENVGVLTLTGYGIWGRFRTALSDIADPSNEFHVSGSAQLKTGDWTFMTGLGRTHAPDQEDEMQFRLTAWGNADNRNFIQTWAQLDDFVWDGQNVFKAGFKYDVGNAVRLPGLSVGASYNYGWNARIKFSNERSRSWEIDYHVEYAFQQERLKGLSVGVYAGHLRYRKNNFHGKDERNDVKVILSYSKTLESFLRRRDK